MIEKDKIILNPQSKAEGVVKLPGSKSISNRLLLLAALSKGATEVIGLLDSDDTQVMLTALEQLGIKLERETTLAQKVTVHGQAEFINKNAKLFMKNAGTAIRPLTAALALSDGHYELSGIQRMHERPIGDLVDALKSIGAQIDYLEETGYPPLSIKPAQLNYQKPIEVEGSVSSQFLTALLMVAPLIAKQTEKDIEIKVKGALISKPYIDITVKLMSRFGVQVKEVAENHFLIEKTASYSSPGKIYVEGDASSASYFIGLGLIGKGPIRIYGINKNSIQGDIYFAQFVEKIGADVIYAEDYIEVAAPLGKNKIKAFDEDFNLIPDAAMTAAVIALYADGPCALRNIASWRVKETDRIEAMHNELEKLGADVQSGEDYLLITPPKDLKNAEIKTYDDHRIAMCFSLACFKQAEITILDPQCVNKTYPDYFVDFKQLLVRG